MPSRDSVKQCVRFVKGANPNAIGAVTSVLGPPLNAFFSFDGPLEYVHIVGDAVMFSGSFSIFQGLTGAMLGALFADFAKSLYP